MYYKTNERRRTAYALKLKYKKRTTTGPLPINRSSCRRADKTEPVWQKITRQLVEWERNNKTEISFIGQPTIVFLGGLWISSQFSCSVVCLWTSRRLSYSCKNSRETSCCQTACKWQYLVMRHGLSALAVRRPWLQLFTQRKIKYQQTLTPSHFRQIRLWHQG